jgi:hypothetical protein
MGVGDLIEAGRLAATRAVETALKQLLEEKHLYQSVTVDFSDAISKAGNVAANAHPMDQQSAANARGIVSRVVGKRWVIAGAREVSDGSQSSYEAPLAFDVPPVRLFCGACRRRERYEMTRAEDLTYNLYAKPLVDPPWGVADQIFVIALLCQSCKAFPEVVTIRRTVAKRKLTLSGRSPMEEAEVPTALPAKESEFFRDALVAHNSGKTLAGLFYLRTFIEQFARRVLNESARRTGQDILADYGKTLPANLRDAMPSLAECYEKLSMALHAANPDADLFETMRFRIQQHFAFRLAAGLTD